MAIKKSELYSSIWKTCDELRGGMDASQYKDYVLVLLFVKYVSDKYSGQRDVLIEVPVGGSFADMVKLKGDKEIGDKMNLIIGHLAEANGLKGVIDLADFNNEDKLGRGKEMVDRLSKLVAIFDNPALDFSRNRAEGDDILGDAYEYLMRHFATESGKSKGQFYTPAEVSQVMAKVVEVNRATRQDQTIYDPTCGSGSLLLKAASEAPRGISIYGQEKDIATTGLAKMNMILHSNPGAEIRQGNTLSTPHFKNPDGSLKTFDFVVANPPFSDKAWSSGLNPSEDEFERFKYGVPPRRNGDYAFLLHIVCSMKSTGHGAMILPHGVLFRGGAEASIRRNLVRNGVIKGVIGLPVNLFYGTSIAACIIVLDKEQAHSRKGIFMIEASRGFMKDGNKNRLRQRDIHKIVDVFNRQVEIKRFSRFVPIDEIEAQDYNLNIARYIDTSDPEDIQDIEAHLKGGIPTRDVDDLVDYWSVCPSLRRKLFQPSSRDGYSSLKMDVANVSSIIVEHPEFVDFSNKTMGRFRRWVLKSTPVVKGIKKGDHPKALIEAIAEDLLSAFDGTPLVGKYDVYQHLMTLWYNVMQDDAYMIVANGWEAMDDGKPNTDLVSPELVVARYFASEKAEIDKLERKVENLAHQEEELEEEHGGEEGLLEEATNDKGRLTKAGIKARLVEIGEDKEDADERNMLTRYLELMNSEAAMNKLLKDKQKELESKTAAKYHNLSDDEIKKLVVDDKWMASLTSDIETELNNISQRLHMRIKQLDERYAMPLPEHVKETETLSARVEAHLESMGFSWK